VIVNELPTPRLKLLQSISIELKEHFKGFTIRRNARRRWLALPGEKQYTLDFLIEELDVAIEVRGLGETTLAVEPRKAELCQICGLDFFVVRDLRLLPAIIERVYTKTKLPYENDPDWRFRWTYQDEDCARLIHQHTERLTDALETQNREDADPYAPYMRIQECLWKHTRINPLRELDTPLGRRALNARLAAQRLLHMHYPELSA